MHWVVKDTVTIGRQSKLNPKKKKASKVAEGGETFLLLSKYKAKANQPFHNVNGKRALPLLPPPLCFLPLLVAIHIAVGLDGIRELQQRVKASVSVF